MTDSSKPKLYDAIIIGAGLAGLTCANQLLKDGFSPLLLEASDAPGGRVRTDIVDGFRLDRGFQVFLSAYPEAAHTLDYARLDLQSFCSGALVRLGGTFTRVADPIREPQALFATLTSDIGSLQDKLKVAYLRQKVMNMPVAEIFRQPERTIYKALKESYGFSDAMIDHFFRPFFGGITLDASLSGSSRMFEFVFKMMSEGLVTVPRLGMGEISKQLAGKIPEQNLRLNCRVQSIEQQNGNDSGDALKVLLADGSKLHGRAIIIATEGPEAHRLCPSIETPEFKRTTCLYFAADKTPVKEAILLLNGQTGKDGLINNICVISNASKDLAPPGQHLISVTVLGDTSKCSDLESTVKQEMVQWFGAEADKYRHLKTYNIAQALPDQSPPWLEIPQKPVKVALDGQNIYVCGDYRDNGSINGAMTSGRRTAQQVLKDLKITVGLA
ncbi:MAG: NAD(P)/FAD-dependent oxidoreductase [Candidatus Obscuribacter sp.]|nr:NAD(P)/FAD-dependent oxidoreductase [Candidatus Obscuribacter sp.]